MRADDVAFVGTLARISSELKAILQAHLDDYGELLPYVALADIERWAEAQFIQGTPRRTEALLAALESEFAADNSATRELITGSFLELLPRPGEEGCEIRLMLGPSLTRQLQQVG